MKPRRAAARAAAWLPLLALPTAWAATCKYVQVQSGDSCWSLAETRCGGISLENLYKYNGGDDSFCDNLKLRTPICCSSGDKPDLTPQEGEDGSCASYTVKSGDICQTIQDEFYLKSGDLDKFNKGKTWGWAGCNKLVLGMSICVSDGTPPMPAPIPNAMCGPQVPGTQRPTNDTKLADLNPCPLNVCCNVWGQCGITDDFCVDTSIDDTPGTAKNGTYGCISNCGMDIVLSDKKPEKFERIGYFEGWNLKDRPCLHMDVTQVGDPITIIHFAFGYINEDFTVSAQGVEEQFEKFKEMTGVKKVISFGGWAFSNEAPTTHIIRNAVKPANAVAFANNVYRFVVDNELDGVDFDWEYPGADDIAGADPGTAEDGKNYLAFLKLMKRRLGSSKTVAIAAPISYWYLRNFPIKEMSDVLDYIVYMTYDLHGQWDVGNKWSSDGCELGNCLRSHVNLTETKTALALITKAGVPAWKIMVGITSYARSFMMAEAGCDGPDCLYLGERDSSQATPGYCTGQAGYIADAEINQIKKIANSGIGGEYYEYYDEDSDSDIIVYDGLQWAAYMSETTKNSRVEWYKSLGFGGASDWAVDLQKDYSDELDDGSDGDEDWEAMDLSYDCNFDKTYASLDELDAAAGDMHYKCIPLHAIKVLEKMLGSSLDGYSDAADGYDSLFDHYEDYMITTMDAKLEAFMSETTDGPGNQFFDCYAASGRDGDRDEAGDKIDCANKPGGYTSWTYYYELRDEEGFAEALLKEGIERSWVKFGEYVEKYECDLAPGNTGCMRIEWVHRGFPRRGDDIEIPDPREIVDRARNNMPALENSFEATYIEVASDTWGGNMADAVDVLSTSVFMLEDAVTQMVEVKEVGEEWKEFKEKELAFKILGSILFVIPFLGASIGSLGRSGAAFARMLMTVDMAGSAGLAIYTMIEDPSMAPMAILDLLLSGISATHIGRGSQFRTLSDAKGRMSPDARDSMGPSFKKNDPKIQSIMGKICPGR